MAERTEARMCVEIADFRVDEVVLFVIDVTVCGSVVPGTAFQCPPIRCPWCCFLTLRPMSARARARTRAHTGTVRVHT